MSDNDLTSAALTRLAIRDANEGDVDDARQLLAEAIQKNPKYEPAWLWLGYLAESDSQRKFCFQQAVSINPESPASARLPDLKDVTAQPPPNLEDILDPPPPPELEAYTSAGSTSGRIPPWLWVAACLLLSGIAGTLLGIWLFRDDAQGDPLYIAVVAGAIAETDSTGFQISKGAQLYLDDLNARGGLDGRPVEILEFDDQDDPQVAEEIASQIAADDRILAVIGHRTSDASMAAAPIYAEAGIPVISPTSSADTLTTSNPWYFRTIFTNSQQGAVVATYTRQFMGIGDVAIISSNDSYGQSLSGGFQEAFEDLGGDVDRSLVLDVSAGDLDAQVATAVAELADNSDPDAIFLALPAELAQQAIVGIRDAEIATPLFGGDTIATNAFVSELTALGSASGQPERYTASLFAASPLLNDSLSGELIYLRDTYLERYSSQPSWRSAMAYDAALVSTWAIGQTLESIDADDIRTRIRDQLTSLDSLEDAVKGINGPIYFDAEGNLPRPVGIATVREGLLASAPMQFGPWTESSGIALEDTTEVNGYRLIEQQVVYTGISFNQVRDFNPATASYFADFLIWFNFVGDESAVDVILVNAAQDEFTVSEDRGLGSPIISIDEENNSYRLYRVGVNLRSQFEFRDFPFDHQQLPITIAHRYQPAGQVVFVIDPGIRAQTPEELLQSAVNAENSIDAIPNWHTDNVTVAIESVGTTSSLGIPEASAGSSGIDYSQFTASVSISRDVRSFLIKNILPLILLSAVTYISLFIPHTQTGVRVSFGITGILTGAVLLSGVTANLPNVDYTVAIEWAFYAFIALSAATIFVGMLGDRFHDERNLSALRKLDWASRTLYPLVIFVVLAWYWIEFA